VAARTIKTTFAKLDRERRLREKREAKRARRDARKADAAMQSPLDPEELDEAQQPAPEDHTPEPPVQS
jgi:hypothetical protein